MTLRLLKVGLAGWWSRRLSIALSMLLVAVAAAALMISVHLGRVADRPWLHTFQATNGAHLIAFGPSSEVARLATADGVVDAAGPLPTLITSMTAKSSVFGLRVLGAEATAPSVEQPVVTTGAWLRGPGEIVLERSFANALSLRVGDAVTARTADGELPLRVAGLAVVAGAAAYPDNQPGGGFVVRSDVERIQPDESGWTWIEFVRFANPSEAGPTALRVADLLPPRTVLETYGDRLADATDRQRTTTIVLRTFSIVLLIAVGLVLATLISSRVLDQERELGLLKAVGCTPTQVVAVVSADVLMTSALAAVIGAFAGAFLTPTIAQQSTELVGAVPVTVGLADVIETVAIIVAVVFASATIPTVRLARASVLQSLRARRSSGDTSRFTRFVPLARPIPGTLGLKTILARPGRSFATALALALSVVCLVAGLSFEATVHNEDAAELVASANRPRTLDVGGLAPTTRDPIAIRDTTREQLRPIVRGFNVVLAAVAVVNLLAAALLSLRQRRRDIALLRATGMTPGQVRWSIYIGDGTLGLAAAILGIPLGCLLFLGVYQIVNGDMALAVLAPAWQLAVVPLVCISAVVAVVTIPARHATAVDVSSAIRFE